MKSQLTTQPELRQSKESQSRIEQLNHRQSLVKPLSKVKRNVLVSLTFICVAGALVLQTMDQNIFIDRISISLFIISCLLVAHINSVSTK